MKYNNEDLIRLTKDGYDRMAKDFSGTRMNFWSELTNLVRDTLQDGNRLLDLGCGNARLYREVDGLPITYYGCDFSEGLIQEALKYHPHLHLAVCDVRHTPYETNFFEVVVSFAVAHHLAGKTAQKDFFKEVERVLKPGGTAIITAWDIWKTRKRKIIRDFFKHTLRGKRFKLGGTIMNFTNYESNRYVYGFSKRELSRLAKGAGFEIEEIRNIKRESKKGREENIVMVVRKKE